MYVRASSAPISLWDVHRKTAAIASFETGRCKLYIHDNLSESMGSVSVTAQRLFLLRLWSVAFTMLGQCWMLLGFRDRPNTRVTLLVDYHNTSNIILCASSWAYVWEHIGMMTLTRIRFVPEANGRTCFETRCRQKHKRLTRLVVKHEKIRHQGPAGRVS